MSAALLPQARPSVCVPPSGRMNGRDRLITGLPARSMFSQARLSQTRSRALVRTFLVEAEARLADHLLQHEEPAELVRRNGGARLGGLLEVLVAAHGRRATGRSR